MLGNMRVQNSHQSVCTRFSVFHVEVQRRRNTKIEGHVVRVNRLWELMVDVINVHS